MDLKGIRKLIRLMIRADLVELEIEEQGKRVKLRRPENARHGKVHFPAMETMSAAPPPTPSAGGIPTTSQPRPEGVIEFRSPMVGTFYASPSPEAEPFVSRGSKVNADTVLCIVEAMKVMNEIKAETQGEITEILVKNGSPVEFGQPLFLIKTL